MLSNRKNCIDWAKVKDLNVPFNYNNSIFGKLYIDSSTDSDNKYFKISFNGREKIVFREQITAGDFVNLIVNSSLRQKYEIGQIVETGTGKTKHQFKILSFGVQTKNKEESIVYKCLCKKCKKIFHGGQRTLKYKTCPHCFKSKISIVDSEPWMMAYFQGGYDEAKKYTRFSKESFYPICPKCGRKKTVPIKITSLKRTGTIGCPCSSGSSYPEKIVYSLLEQLGIDFKYQVSTNTLGFNGEFKLYDFYIKKYLLIIETHGIQHYKSIKNWNSFERQQRNDKYKKDLAMNNGITNYIVLDCRYSNIEWIRRSIMKSNLPTILNFNEDDINWNICKTIKIDSITEQICGDYHNNFLTVSELAEKYNKSPRAINRCLNKGDSVGLCIHNKNVNTISIPIEVLKDNTHIGYFKNLSNTKEYFNNTSERISSYYTYKLLKEGKSYKGYTIKYVEDIPLRWKILKGEVA